MNSNQLVEEKSGCEIYIGIRRMRELVLVRILVLFSIQFHLFKSNRNVKHSTLLISECE
jgi:hypothetical protein